MKGGRRQLCRCVWEHSRERRQEGPELCGGGTGGVFDKQQVAQVSLRRSPWSHVTGIT